MRSIKSIVKPVYRLLRRPVLGLRDARDKRLHKRRSEEAAARLHRFAPHSVLMLCLGNICRSPYAARVLSSLAPDIRVDSAGFIGPGRSPPEIALAVARKRDVHHADHRSKVLTPSLLAEADAVLVFDRANASRLAPMFDPARMFWLGDFDPVWSGTRAIADPWGKDREAFERTFVRIERCLGEVARSLRSATKQTHGSTRPTRVSGS